MLGLFHTNILCDILNEGHHISDRQQIAQYYLKKVSQAIDSSGGTVFVVKNPHNLYPIASYGAILTTLQQQEFPIGQGIVGVAAQSRIPIKVDNTRTDRRFWSAIDARTGFQTRSAIAAPILFGQRLQGVIEFINKKKRTFFRSRS